MKKRVWSLCMAVIMAGTLLGGCGNGAGAGTGTPADSGQTADAGKTDGEQVTIRFMDNMASETRDRAYEEIIANFEAENPDIKIEYETVPWDQSHS